jgi:phosphoribosylglycinamide formyltransferase-1
MSAPPINLAVLVSGSGTTLQNFIDTIAAGELDARIALVIASKPGILAIDRAKKAGLPIVVSEPANVFDHCTAAKVDLVCLAGWLQLLKIPRQYVNRVLNIHPALLPDFGGRGMYGMRVHEAVLKSGQKITGCTVHFVDDEYDHGPILLQRVCPVLEGDTPATLAHRVFEEERIAYPEAIRRFQSQINSAEGLRVQAT